MSNSTSSTVSAKGLPFNHLDYTRHGCSRSLFLNTSSPLRIAVTRASREGSEDPGRGGHVSDRTESPGALAEEELLQWRPSLFHGDPAKCDGHLQKSNLHPSSRRRAGRQRSGALSGQKRQKSRSRKHPLTRMHLQHLRMYSVWKLHFLLHRARITMNYSCTVAMASKGDIF